jgi:hypothetical protein
MVLTTGNSKNEKPHTTGCEYIHIEADGH